MQLARGARRGRQALARHRHAARDRGPALLAEEPLEVSFALREPRGPRGDGRGAAAANRAVVVEKNDRREVGERRQHERGRAFEQRVHVERARHDLRGLGEEARAPLRFLRDRARRLLARERNALVGAALELGVELMQLHQRLHLAAQHVRHHGRQDVVHGAERVAARRVHLVGEGGDEDDRRVRGLAPRADELGGFQPVHARHIHVEKDHGALVVEEPPQRLLARGCRHDVLLQLLQDRAENDALVEPVVDDEDVRGLGAGNHAERVIPAFDRRQLRAGGARRRQRCSHAFSTASSWSRSTGFDR